MAQVKSKSVIGYLVFAVSVIGFTVFVFTYPPIQRRFDPKEYPILFGMALLFVIATTGAIGLKFWGDLESFQRTAVAKLFARSSFYFGIFAPLAAVISLAIHSWVLFMVTMITGGVLRILSRKAPV